MASFCTAVISSFTVKPVWSITLLNGVHKLSLTTVSGQNSESFLCISGLSFLCMLECSWEFGSVVFLQVFSTKVFFLTAPSCVLASFQLCWES